ncbi:MAG: hypothetical protein BroJett007_34160 [Chloroflexota bacterium]|nr:MAG: hypothetical protein BroJett007_34160 [Chloroflexota bacterium]
MSPPTGTHVCIRFTRIEDYLEAGSVRASALASVAPDVDAYSPEADAAWGAFKEQLKSYIAGRNTFVVFNGLLCAVIDGYNVELPVVKGTWRTATSTKDKRHITKWGLKAAIGLRLRRGVMAVKYLSITEHRAANSRRGADYASAIERAKVRLNERVFSRVNTLCNEPSRFAVCDKPGCIATRQRGTMVEYHTLASTNRDARPIAHVRCQDHAPETIGCHSCANTYAKDDATPLSRLVADRWRREGYAAGTLLPTTIDAMAYLTARDADGANQQAAAPVITYRAVNGSQTSLCACCINHVIDGTTSSFEVPRTLHLHHDGVYGVSPPPAPPDAELRDYNANVLNVCAAPGGKLLYVELAADGAMVTGSLADTGLTLFGVELEVETNLTASAMVEAMPKAGGRQVAIVKRDGSLDRNRGREVVTLPMTMAAQRAWWREFLEHPSIKGKLASYRGTNGRCGCHIHIGLARLTGTQAAVIAYLVAHRGNAKLTDLVARRRYSNYAKQIALAKGVSIDRLAYAVATLGHYGAASYARHGTLEIRVYKGTALYNGLLIYLEHAESLVAYVKACVPATQVDLPTDCDVGEATHYLDWLKSQVGFERLKRHLSLGEAAPPWVLENAQSPVQALAQQEDEAEAEAETDAPF